MAAMEPWYAHSRDEDTFEEPFSHYPDPILIGPEQPDQNPSSHGCYRCTTDHLRQARHRLQPK